MSLTIETGTGATNSNSFVTLEYCNDYHSDRGNTSWTNLNNSAKEGAIIRAADYINGLVFKGMRTSPDQAMAFPRTGLVDRDGYELSTGAIPTQVKFAQCEAALRESVTQGSTQPDLDNSTAQLKRKKVDVVESEWFETPASKVTHTAIDTLLKPFKGSSSTKTIRRS